MQQSCTMYERLYDLYSKHELRALLAGQLLASISGMVLGMDKATLGVSQRAQLMNCLLQITAAFRSSIVNRKGIPISE